MAGFVEFVKWRPCAKRRMARNEIGGFHSIEECPGNNDLLAAGGVSNFPPVRRSEIFLDVAGPHFFQVACSESLQVFKKVLGVSAISNLATTTEIARGHVLGLESGKCFGQAFIELRFLCHRANGAL